MYTYTYVPLFQSNLDHNECEGKILDVEAWDMMLESWEIQKLKETAEASVRTQCLDMIWSISPIWTAKN